mgnify:FL=1
MNKIHELLGYDRIKIIQNDEMFSFSLDSMLLANFVNTKGSKNIIDLGTGNAPIPLFLTLKTDAKIVGVEIQKEVYDLACESVKINNFEKQISIINSDIKDIYKTVGANNFDIVICNPPFFKYSKESIINKNDYLTIARHEVLVTIVDIIKEANKLLCNGGKLYLVHRVNRMTEVIKDLEENNFGIKKIQLIYPVKDKDAYMFLLEAKKNRPTDLVIGKPLIVYENNEYTEEVKEIFNFNKNK